MKNFCYYMVVHTCCRKGGNGDDNFLIDSAKPSFIYDDEESAEKELLRLSAKKMKRDGLHYCHEFMIFKAIKTAKRIPGTEIFRIEEAFPEND